MRRPLLQDKTSADALEPDMAVRRARRRALGLGALVALFTFIGRGSARAAEPLTIGADGVILFNGKRNFFTDEENQGKLRVGAAWGVPGIYSQQGSVVVGSQNGNIWLNGKVGIGKKEPAQSLDVAGNVKAEAFETNSGISLAAVQNAVTILIPVGTIMAYGGDTRNDAAVATLKGQGWLPCDGRAYAAQEYPELAKVIGNSFGNFRVPDLRGRFLRGTDHGTKRDPDAGSRRAENGGNGGDNVGSVQDDEFRSHQHQYNHFPGARGGIASGDYWTATDTQTGAAGGNETRPKNVCVNWIIRAK
jgi:microcystin-dependent protein